MLEVLCYADSHVYLSCADVNQANKIKLFVFLNIVMCLQ
jgi:hypothetical protein